MFGEVDDESRELSCESCVFSARWGIDEDASDATACLQPTSSTEPPPMRNMYLQRCLMLFQRANRDSHVRPTLSSRSFIRPEADLGKRNSTLTSVSTTRLSFSSMDRLAADVDVDLPRAMGPANSFVEPFATGFIYALGTFPSVFIET